MLSKVTFTPAVGSAVDLHASTGSYKVSRADGIVGPPEPREVSRTAPGRDGTLDDTRFLTDRKITLEGEIIGSSQSDVWTKWDALAAAFQSTLLSKGTLTVTLPDGSTQRQCTVILTGSAQPSFEGGSAYLQYQVNFRAPDPRWYGTTLNTSALTISATAATTSSSANVTNAGNAPSAPKLTWSPVSSGLYFDYATFTVPTAYTSLSPQGSTIVLDGSTGSAAISNNNYVDCATRTTNTTSVLTATTEWPVLYPGTSSWNWTQQYAGSTSNSTCTVSWRDAWW